MTKKSRILMVEDDNLTVEILRNELHSLGYEVAGAVGTGEEAIRSAGELMPDLILMDIVLGGRTDGIETAEQIVRTWDIPVVYLTAYGDDSFFSRAKLTMPFGYLLKPVQTYQLHHTIEMALYRHRYDRLLRESECWYRTIFETTGGAALVVREDATIEMVNHEFELFSGYACDEVEQRMSWRRFFRGDELADMEAKLLALRAGP
jgi:CheY-like chemotaxis protein